MLRPGVTALAVLAFLSAGPVSAQNSPPAAVTAESTGATPAAAAPAVVAKVEETAAPSDTSADTAPANATTPEPAAEKAPQAPSDAASDKPAETPAAAAAEPAKPAPPAEPTLTASINLGSQTITVSEHGVQKYTWAISSGTRSHPTPTGTFRPQWTAKMWYSRKYDNAPMPHAVFVHGGVAIHATYATGMLGRPASHGCIRLSPTNAKVFYGLVNKHGIKNTRVAIYGTPKWGSDPYVASRKTTKRYAALQQQKSSGSTWDWFGTSSAPAPVAKPAYVYKKRKGGPTYYYASNGNVYVLKGKAPRLAKKYYYNGYGYGY